MARMLSVCPREVPRIRDCSLHPHWRFPAPTKDQGKARDESLWGGAAPQIPQPSIPSVSARQGASSAQTRGWSCPQTPFSNAFGLLGSSALLFTGTHSAPGGAGCCPFPRDPRASHPLLHSLQNSACGLFPVLSHLLPHI